MSDFPLETRAMILYCLCEAAMLSPPLLEHISVNFDPDAQRTEFLGQDSFNNSYIYFSMYADFRLYRISGNILFDESYLTDQKVRRSQYPNTATRSRKKYMEHLSGFELVCDDISDAEQFLLQLRRTQKKKDLQLAEDVEYITTNMVGTRQRIDNERLLVKRRLVSLCSTLFLLLLTVQDCPLTFFYDFS